MRSIAHVQHELIQCLMREQNAEKEAALLVPYLTGFSGRNSPVLYKTYMRLIDSGIGKFWFTLTQMRQEIHVLLAKFDPSPY